MTNFVSPKFLKTFQILKTFKCTVSSIEIEAQNSPLHNNMILQLCLQLDITIDFAFCWEIQIYYILLVV